MSGWWTSTNEEEAKALEAKKNDDFRVATFSTVIDGKDGELIPHWKDYPKVEIP